jgi:hypothetical protein
LRAITPDRGFQDVVSRGIVRDADSDPVGAFQSVTDALRNANLPVPEQILIPTGQKPKVAVIILPKPHAHGMMEDLYLEEVVPSVQVFLCQDFLLGGGAGLP